MNPTQGTTGYGVSGYDFPPYSHTQPFVQPIPEDPHGQKRFISPESQVLTQQNIDKRLRHNSLEYVLDLNSPSTQPTFIRRVTLEDVMRGIDSLTANSARKEDLKDLATKQDLITLEGSVKAQATELHQLRTAFNKQQGELNSLRATVDGNCAAILNATERSADRGEEGGHRMYTNNGGPHVQTELTKSTKRYNLVIEGVPDVPMDEVYAFVIQLADALNVILYKRDISNITRISRRSTAAGDRPKPGPVVVTFVHAHLRDAILRNKVDLNVIQRYKSVYVNPDEPLDVRRQKARFRRIAYLARQDGHVVSYRGDSIRIGNDEYKVSEIANIPDKYIPKDGVRPTNMQEKDEDVMPPLGPAPAEGTTAEVPDVQDVQRDSSSPEIVPASEASVRPKATPVFQDSGRTELRGGRICFSGATSFLSNFFLVCFIYCNIKYQSLEQCYHHTHAIMAKALEVAALIYKETDGVELKILSKRIPYCEEWGKVCGPKMDEMLQAKFSQNPSLMDKLMRTAPYELVEASVDMKWGGGVSHGSHESMIQARFLDRTSLGLNSLDLETVNLLYLMPLPSSNPIVYHGSCWGAILNFLYLFLFFTEYLL